ncbi:hypothetical protein M406DRAFT_331891 [Cryphonectria parasitica EP155]|uniref:Uncharacterized protein n=1 Tax=Cryphonectria parasitica (strain ATCC 38755 / EP155) TaxID=660469 RepID=A0A9P5CLI3_CRYP1|nr:uncharacterized protein M406DRAFT_331891 [Cryphonectria parasitica EP155]KAF3763369.1 hypothetical protein M406DRAFT_331891 [Cryphonectria parasitica EP155]
MEAILFHDINFPELRKPRQMGDDLDYGPDQNDGTVVPGIIDVSGALGTASFGGLPDPTKPEFIFDPACGADIIVTVLYQYRPSALRQFLDCRISGEFTFVHRCDLSVIKKNHHTDIRPFVITRKGAHVEAGYRTGYTNGEPSQEWEEIVSYDILLSNTWRQGRCQFPGSNPDMPFTLALNRNAVYEERRLFEDTAVAVLTPALTQRRWWAAPRGWTIRVTAPG